MSYKNKFDSQDRKEPFGANVFRDASGRQYYKSTKIRHTPEGTSERERKLKAAENKRLVKAFADRAEEATRGNAIARQRRHPFKRERPRA